MIIAIYGNGIGAGKTKAASDIVDLLRTKRPRISARVTSFAQPAKWCLAVVGWGGAKTPRAREALGMICDAHRLVVDDYPAHVLSRIERQNGIVIIDDMRRQDEYDAVRRVGAPVIEVVGTRAAIDDVLEIGSGYGDYRLVNDYQDNSERIADIVSDILMKAKV